jgi:hypothetical protein
VTKVEHGAHHRDKLKRPDPGKPVPDEIRVHSQIQPMTDIAIPVSQNESAQDEKEIDPKVTFITEAEAEHVIVEQRHTADAKSEVKEGNEKGSDTTHGGEAEKHALGLRFSW